LARFDGGFDGFHQLAFVHRAATGLFLTDEVLQAISRDSVP
jgi:hypothetical protein